MVKVNGVRSRPFILTHSIRLGCPLSSMLCIIALEPFLRKLKADPVLRCLTLPGSTEVARYTSYADDISVLVISSVDVVEVNKEIGRFEVVTGVKINREKSVGLQLGSWKGCALPGLFSWKDSPCKILGVWFGPNLQLEKNWSEVLEKVVAATELWLCRPGWGIRLAHLPLRPLPTFSATNSGHHPIQFGKDTVPVYLG